MQRLRLVWTDLPICVSKSIPSLEPPFPAGEGYTSPRAGVVTSSTRFSSPFVAGASTAKTGDVKDRAMTWPRPQGARVRSINSSQASVSPLTGLAQDHFVRQELSVGGARRCARRPIRPYGNPVGPCRTTDRAGYRDRRTMGRARRIITLRFDHDALAELCSTLASRELRGRVPVMAHSGDLEVALRDPNQAVIDSLFCVVHTPDENLVLTLTPALGAKPAPTHS